MHILGPHKYQQMPRRMVDGVGRVYTTPEGEDLPSVTTLLGNTLSREKKDGLEGWATSIGVENAVRIKEEAAHVGSWMHDTLEAMLAGERPKPGADPLAAQGVRMATEVFPRLFPMIDELWGLEVPLHLPGNYAGTTDVVGVINGKPAIADFKQSNRKKYREWLSDYPAQCALYCMAHNILYGTSILDFYIIVCTRDLVVDIHHFEDADFAAAVDEARERVRLWKTGYRCTTDF